MKRPSVPQFLIVRERRRQYDQLHKLGMITTYGMRQCGAHTGEQVATGRCRLRKRRARAQRVWPGTPVIRKMDQAKALGASERLDDGCLGIAVQGGKSLSSSRAFRAMPRSGSSSCTRWS